ncbi:MAG: hypothetical protein JXA03_12095 [Bacteroidales bacterium]|nr:hypothetical protein [Bacteroidales bacterium]
MFRKLVLSVVVMILLFFAGAFLWIRFNEEKLKDLIVNEINGQLAFNLTAGDVDFDLFSHFPMVSLRFTEVSTEKDNAATDPLFRAASVSVLFNLIEVYKGDYSLRKLSFQDVFLYIAVHEDGTANYDKFAVTTDTSEAGSLVFDRISLKNLQVVYQDIPGNNEIHAGSPLLRLSGEIQGSRYSFTVNGEMHLISMKLNGKTGIKEKRFNTEVQFVYDRPGRLFSINKARMKSGKVEVSVSGSMGRELLNMELRGTGSIANFLDEIPELKEFWPDEMIELNGDLDFSAKINGTSWGNSLPEIQAQWELQHAAVALTQYGMTMENVYTRGVFYAPDPRKINSFRVRIDTATGRTASGVFSASASIENFSSPEITLAVECEMDLSELQGLFPPEKINRLEGRINLSCLYHNVFPGFSGLTPEDFRQSISTGNITISDGTLLLGGSNLTCSSLCGSFDFSGDDITVKEFRARIPGSEFELGGRFRNLLQWSFFRDEKLEAEVSLKSSGIDLDKILRPAGNKDTAPNKFNVSDNVMFIIELSTDTLTAGNFTAINLKGVLKLENHILHITNASFSAFGGTVGINGLIDGSLAPGYSISCRADITHAGIGRMFYELNEFGQNNLTSRNLSGDLTTAIDFKCRTGEKFNIIPSSVLVMAEVEILNGELSGYSPLYRLSRFIDRDELELIRFSALRNDVTIRNEKVFIPEMAIESSTCDLRLQGVHTFDNIIDYHVWVRLKSLMPDRKKEDFEDDYQVVIEDDGYGNTSIPLWLSGPAEDPGIKYDSRAVAKKWEDDFKREKNTFGNLIKNEFSGNRKKTNETTAFPEPQPGRGKVIIGLEEDSGYMKIPEKSFHVPGIQAGKEKENKKNEKILIRWDEDEPDSLRLK